MGVGGSITGLIEEERIKTSKWEDFEATGITQD